MDIHEELKRSIKDEIKRAAIELDDKYGLKQISGFALGTDDGVRTLYHAVCTHEWVKQQEARDYEGIGYIFVEWVESADESLFLTISNSMARQADAEFGSDDAWRAARDKRFLAICAAMSEARQEGVFDGNTFLMVGSTDPSDYMENLEWSELRKFNSEDKVRHYADAMGYEYA